MNKIFVLLKDSTTGWIYDNSAKVGDWVCVTFQNENGLTSYKQGKIIEILS